MTRDPEIFIEDILEAINKIDSYIKGLKFDAFKENELVIDAVVRNIEIIGEASKHIPQEIKKEHSEVPWNKMVGLRNIIIHEYFGIDLEIIWHIITVNLPETKPYITELLKK
ncbi:DUF86 domain-containing protein [bacterium]|nr:DUF86 domain-containing protein [bacterium]